MSHEPTREEIIKCLEEFLCTINANGGIILDDDGLTAPAGDPEWIDLGEVYMQACALLNTEPVYHQLCSTAAWESALTETGGPDFETAYARELREREDHD